MHISLTLRRHFWWHRAVLFPEYLPLSPSKQSDLEDDSPFAATVFLSEKDQIVPYEEVSRHLTYHDVRCVGLKGFVHGQVCVSPVFSTAFIY
ncbi:hypothetical protein HDU67_008685 [Dinochytrium kinnereticum]|nr:hypothetical protein HDU67_008685 [Dinochytrium kinnereticum]